MFDHVFSPIEIGSISIPNRICFSAHITNLGTQGLVNQGHIDYYAERAKGGCGLLIIGELSLHPSDRPREHMIEAYDETVLPGYKKLTEAVHEHKAKVFAQLNHSGFQCDGAISRLPVFGPSPMADIEFGETAKVMEPEEIEEIVNQYEKAARCVKEGGFDGIEISIGHRSLLRQFLSPLSNHRTDEYGGSLENRMRLAQEVIDSVRDAVGRDYPVGILLCADEMFYGAITLDESKEMARRFEESSQVDFVNIALATYYNLHLVHGSMHHPPAFTVHLSEGIKEAVKVPVFANNRINRPEMAEEILASRKADMIGMVRPLICDPQFANKAKEGRPEDIFICVADNQGCVGRVNQHKTIGCIQNPAVGFERTLGDGSIQPTPKKKRIMVVGGGPAGMEAARVAAMRGHNVILYERQGELGGQINIAKKGAGREEIGRIVSGFLYHLQKLEVALQLNVEVTEEMVEKDAPDAVVIATGSVPKDRPLPGRYSSSKILNVWQVLKEEVEVGDRVLLLDYDGHHKSTGTAEFLADQAKKVDIITDALFVGVELGAIGDLYSSRQRLLQKGVTFISDMKVREINGTEVKAVNEYSNKTETLKGYDSIVIAMENRPCDDLYFRLKGKVKELYRVGDCVAPRRIDMAILEGNAIGRKL
jgi:mycofactocin system FadH/OYE family oxidoreductase 2